MIVSVFILMMSIIISTTTSSPLPSGNENEVSLPDSPAEFVEYGFDHVTPDDAPIIPELEVNSVTHSYAVDLSGRTNKQQFTCLKGQGYRSVFVRAFDPSGDGSFDKEAVKTIEYAFEAGLGTEVYITPKYDSTLSGSSQVSKVYQGLIDSGISIRSVWIQVTSPSKWPGTTLGKINFISSMIRRARELGLTVGIYTSPYDWNQITENWNNVGGDVLLWYWHVLGNGSDGESERNLKDFRSFGPWETASVKQFAQAEKSCGLVVNRNVYASRVAQTLKKTNEVEQVQISKIMVGSIGL